MNRRDKRQKDQFSVLIMGIIAYTIVLLLVVFGTYLGVKHIFRKHDLEEYAKAAKKATEEIIQRQETKELEEPEEEVKATSIPEPAPKEPEESVQEHILEKTKYSDKDGVVDFAAEVARPGKREEGLKWKDTVFTRLEQPKNPKNAPINKLSYKRLFVRSKDNEDIELDVFFDMESDLVEKVTQITSQADGLNTTDFYYDDGRINYVAVYDEIIDVPTDWASAEYTSKYYFAKDVLVEYEYFEDGETTEYSLKDMDTYSKGTVATYDSLEKEMLNRAYVVYNLARSRQQRETVRGYVLDEFNTPLEDAHVVLTASDGTEVAASNTDGDGFYTFDIAINEEEKYTLKVTKDTLKEVSVYGITSIAGSGSVEVDPVYMSYRENGFIYDMVILVKDATDSEKNLSGAVIKIRNGINNTNGEVFVTGDVNETSTVTVPLMAGSYTAEVSRDGYETSFFTVTVKIDHKAEIGYLVPSVPEKSYTAVLSWETSPLDLDFAAISNSAAEVKRGLPDSVGTVPEVITISEKDAVDYRLYVSDFSSCTNNNPMSYDLSSSGAVVDIYGDDGLIAKYHVPVAYCGVVWEACRIRNHRVVPVNRYNYRIQENSIWTIKQ